MFRGDGLPRNQETSIILKWERSASCNDHITADESPILSTGGNFLSMKSIYDRSTPLAPSNQEIRDLPARSRVGALVCI
jgi:hypothetical protein